MLKKIIAAAAASTLAVSALAASADAAATVVYTANRVDTVKVTLKGESSASELAIDAPLKDGKKDSDQEYSELKFKVKNLFDTDDAYGKAEKLNITSGKVNVHLEGKATVIDKVNASEGTVTFKDSDVKTDADASIDSATLKPSTVDNARETKEVTVKPSFGLTDKNEGYKLLKSLDDSKTKVTTELTLELTENQFWALMSGTAFDTKADIWENTKTLATFDEDFTDALADGINVSGMPLELYATKKADGAEATRLATSWKITAMDIKTTPSLGLYGSMQVPGAADDGADEWGRADLREFINGGKVSFKFNRKIQGKEWLDVSVRYRNDNIQNDIIMTDYTENGDTLTVAFPANFSYSANTNEYPTFSMAWTFEAKLDTEIEPLELLSITFTANENADNKNDSSNGGLVEDDNKNDNSTSSDSKPSTPSNDNTNSGSNSNDNKNPSTGVAMAVAPVALAAAAAVVVISKKRK